MSSQPKSRLPIIPFIAILSAVLFVANLVVYEAVAGIFSLTSQLQLAALGTVLGVLSASLIVSTISGMYFYNIFTRLYSTISAIWIGSFVYLFLTSVLYGLVTMFGIKNTESVGEFLLAIALVASAYGIVHARNTRIVEVSVRLKNLPEQWVGKKAAWVSDLHLGQILGSWFARVVMQKINSVRPDIVFIGGDLFDGTSAPDLDKLIAPLKDISSTHGTYYVTGNHEEFGNNEKFIAAVKGAGIEVLQNSVVSVEGLQIIGVDYDTTSEREPYKKILSNLKIDSQKASILLKHEPKDLDLAAASGISLQISGHTHQAQLWPLRYIANAVYKGYAYGLKKYDAMQMYTSSGVGTWGPPMRVGTRSEVVVFTFTRE